jgi:hypothetical protein
LIGINNKGAKFGEVLRDCRFPSTDSTSERDYQHVPTLPLLDEDVGVEGF